jgi:hypothetical protein
MEDLLTIKIVGCARLLLAAGIFFFWIPRKILPQEYIQNRLDRVMFNCLHMCALATLVFPVFVALRFFGFPFLILFFVATRLLFLKFWYRRPLKAYLRDEVYNCAIVYVLRALDDQGAFVKRHLTRLSRSFSRLGAALAAPKAWWAGLGAGLVVSYALFLRLSAVFATMAPAVSDLYQYYYWNQILKLNRLFDKVAGAPYPWGSPVLISSVNLFADLNTVVLYGCFPVLVLGFSFFTLYYFCRRTLTPESGGSPAPLLALLLCAIVIPSPLAESFFGTVYRTVSPGITHLWRFAFYTGVPGLKDEILTGYPQIFFQRTSTVLPYEVAASFATLLVYFLHRALVTRRRAELLLFAETLAIISALHPGVLIALFPVCLLVAARATLSLGLDARTFFRGLAALSAGLAAGNLWLVQMAVYGLPADVGAAAPILDRIFHTRRAAAEVVAAAARPELQLVAPSPLQWVLALCALALLGQSFRGPDRERGVARSVIPLFTLAILFLYFLPNLGLPRLVDQSRLQGFLALSYGLTAAQCYLQFLEQGVLRRLWGNSPLGASRILVGLSVAGTILATPRFIDDPAYRLSTTKLELPESSYYVYKIEDTFQPFSYTVVSYLEGFPLLVSHGYHMNTQDLLTTCSPLKNRLDIPSELVFIFVENAPVRYQGSGEYWFRWRADVMLKLKDWIVLYGARHRNLRLWRQSKNLQIYLIDNSGLRQDDAQIRQRLEDPKR